MSSKSGVGKDPRHDIIVTLFQKIFFGPGMLAEGERQHGPKTSCLMCQGTQDIHWKL